MTWMAKRGVLVWVGDTDELDDAAEPAPLTEDQRRAEQRRRDAEFFLDARLAREARDAKRAAA